VQKLNRFIKMFVKFIFYASLTGLVILVLPRLITAIYATSRIQSVEEIDAAPVAVVFGAGLWRDGSPTPVLRDRVETASELYFANKVEKLLMSGDNSVIDYNEPEAMRRYALELGVPDEDIVLDYAGRRTYDTCYRARDIFGLRDVILVTQNFHLPRALYICNALDVQASGVPATNHYFLKRTRTYWQMRETVATLVAFVEVHITKPLPILGEFEPIFPTDQTGETP
jgi:vancomycin permeability regulator SanA